MRLIPGDLDRAGRPSPVLSCTTRGLPCHAGCPDMRWALTPPFHPCLCPCGPSAVCSLLHFPSGRLATSVPRFHEARCPMVSGLSSTMLLTHDRDRPGGGERRESREGPSSKDQQTKFEILSTKFETKRKRKRFGECSGFPDLRPLTFRPSTPKSTSRETRPRRTRRSSRGQ